MTWTLRMLMYCHSEMLSYHRRGWVRKKYDDLEEIEDYLIERMGRS